MLSFFTIPKSFTGHSAVIQRNAIQSWLALDCPSEVFLLGDDPGVGAAAAEFGAKHIPDIAKNEYGTPLLSSAFDIVQEKASYNTICYINTDIMIMDDFVSGIRTVKLPSFLLIGRRWNLDLNEAFDFSDLNWQEKLRNILENTGTLHPALGSDYFVFPKRDRIKLPDFAVGRPAWDNWLIYETWKRGRPIIDASNAITIIHQNHDYAHVPYKNGIKWNGPEAIKNRKLLSNKFISNFTTMDASHIIISNEVKRAFTREHLRYKWFRIPRLYSKLTLAHNAVTRLLFVVFGLYRKLKI